MILKKAGKAVLCRLLERQVRQLRRRNDFMVVAVAGSVGKTSTKLAIASLLANSQKVRYQDGNYNDRLTVPLVLFGQAEPAIFNLAGWLKILLANQRTIRQPYDYDVAVLELGTDRPGELARFAYLQPDIMVITAVAPEHMQFFGSLDAVGREELTPLKFSKRVLLNIDDIPSRYLPSTDYLGYGQGQAAYYRLVSSTPDDLKGQQLEFTLSPEVKMNVRTTLLGRPGASIVVAGAAVADMLGWSQETIRSSLPAIHSVPGRMKLLPGIEDSVLIDDSYNSSPIAAKAALDVLYRAKASRRIAILGSMNELGRSSPAEHRSVGAYCQPDKLDMVITIGSEAEKYLAPAALKNGCQVRSFSSPYEAGAYVIDQLQPGTAVLAKGSQNGVFAEEALKQLLRKPDDAAQLVRQSPAWLKLKRRQFPDAA
jgi:UDP-N-acetylmuramoyl-tripeptide--D-alanyl-D-alanine ligase